MAPSEATHRQSHDAAEFAVAAADIVVTHVGGR